jgi:hypothetical protein
VRALAVAHAEVVKAADDGEEHLALHGVHVQALKRRKRRERERERGEERR